MKPRVTFRVINPRIASSRLRAIIPQRELAKVGIERGTDILVLGKHGYDWIEATAGYKKIVFDVCDDWFESLHQAHYLQACSAADAVTCNSREMARIIKVHTGRDAWVIDDPWEAEQQPARVHDSLVWFGHKWNLGELEPWVSSLAGRKLAVVSNAPLDARMGHAKFVEWSHEAMDRECAAAGLAVLPTGRSMAKSANRAIESVRRGLYPICGYLPANADIGVWVGDISDGVEWALTHHDQTMRRIRDAQEYVNWQYHPARIAKLWLEALSYV